MHFSHSTLALLTLLASRTIALPYDEHPTGGELTKMVIVTVTHTLEEGSPSFTPPIDHTFPYSTPGEPCTPDGISIWPSGTTSLVVPTFTLDPIESSNATTTKSASTSCTHSMSHIIPGIGNNTSVPDPTLLPTNDEPVASKKEGSDASPKPTASGEEVKTSVLDPVAWAGIGNTLMTRAKRSEDIEQVSGAEVRRKVFWARMFALAHPLFHAPAQIVRDEGEDGQYEQKTKERNRSGCVECEKGRDLVCINGTHFGIVTREVRNRGS